MPFAASLSEHPNAATAVGETCGRVLDELGEAPDVALLFVTPHHATALPDIVGAVRRILDPAVLVGCVAASVVGTEREVEERPGLTLWAAVTGPAQALHVAATPNGEGEVTLAGWPDLSSVGFEPSALVLVADPYTFPTEAFLAFVDEHHPGLPVVGGLASGPGAARLVLDGRVLDGGAVGVLLGPDIEVETVVSQGCRPIGQPWTVTAGEGNVVRELAGRPPLHRLVALAEAELTEEEITLVNRGALHVGRVIDEAKSEFVRGDFLVRNVVGADQSTGAIAIGDAVTPGLTLQFQLRDAAAAHEDLHVMLQGHHVPDSALLFTCNGRGIYTFGTPDHDAATLAEEMGPIPVAGFFAAGELGPVGGRNFLHGFTASIALLSDKVKRK